MAVCMCVFVHYVMYLCHITTQCVYACVGVVTRIFRQPHHKTADIAIGSLLLSAQRQPHHKTADIASVPGVKCGSRIIRQQALPHREFLINHKTRICLRSIFLTCYAHILRDMLRYISCAYHIREALGDHVTAPTSLTTDLADSK